MATPSESWLFQPKLEIMGFSLSDIPLMIYPVLLSVPFLYGIKSFSWKRRQSLVQHWTKHYEDFKILSPYILPEDKSALRGYLKQVTLVAVCTVAMRITNLLTPVLLRQIVDALTSREGHFPWVEIIAYVLVRQPISQTLQSIHWNTLFQIESITSDRLTTTLYNKLMSLSADYHDARRPSDAFSTVATSGYSLSRFVASIIFDKIPCLIDLVIAMIAFWRIFDGNLALVAALIALVYVVISALMTPKKSEGWERSLNLRRKRDDQGSDTLANWATVSAFNRVEYEKTRFAALVEEVRDGRVESIMARQLLDSRKDMIMAGGLVAVSLLASYQIRYGGRSVGDFIMLLTFWGDLAFPLQNLVHWLSWIEEFFTEARRMLDILKEEPTVRDREGAPQFVFKRGDIEFEGVGFSYDGKRPAVQDVSFRLEGGKTIAIVGETGGGKSTLLKLLYRMYDPAKGSIKIDGQDVRDVRLSSLMEHISIVPQIIGVFNASILDNLKYGRLDATQEQCEEACQAAALHKKISSFPKGYDELVGPKGTKLSGGELQRLAIARALLRDSHIVLFDEAMSSLDSETEWAIQERMRRWCADKTVVIVAHRLATIAHADLILAVKDGRIVEAGCQEELLEKKGYYYSLWSKQKLV